MYNLFFNENISADRDDYLKISLTCHLVSDHAQLLRSELDGDLLDLAVGSDDCLDNLNAALRGRHLLANHLGGLELDHLGLCQAGSWRCRLYQLLLLLKCYQVYNKFSNF